MDLRLSAMVAPYLQAITKARAAGWRWRDVRVALALNISDRSIAQAVRRCRWQAEQLPLPDTRPVSSAIASSNTSCRKQELIVMDQKKLNEQDEIEEFNLHFSMAKQNKETQK